jgi:hypothetical protein
MPATSSTDVRICTRGIEECADRDPSGARVGAILQALIAREPVERSPSIRAWLPPGFVPPQVTIVSAKPSTAVMMVRSLEPHNSLHEPFESEAGGHHSRAAIWLWCAERNSSAQRSLRILHVMTSASLARATVCRYCGLHAESHGHANIGECVGALAREVALLRDHLRQRGTRPSAFSPRTSMSTFRDRRLCLMPSR